MSRLLYADFVRMYSKRRAWLFCAAMAGVSVMFIVMQYTAMDYEVSIDRVIFLPMSFYGVITAALVSLFIGDDFSDGVIRNKLVAGRSRSAIYLSNLITVWSACILLYIAILTMTLGIGSGLFENNVTIAELWEFLGLGLLTCLSYGSLFGLLSMVIGNKSTAVLTCMGLSFVMLFLSLHTNDVVVQTEYKNGVLNSHFVTGIRRFIYEFMHDINPTGQAAQLSAMKCLNPGRWILCSFIWILIAVAVGNVVFQKKDIL